MYAHSIVYMRIVETRSSISETREENGFDLEHKLPTAIKERLPIFQRHWQNIILEGQTEHGMPGSLDGRFNGRVFNRDTMTVAEDIYSVLKYQPNTLLWSNVKKSLLGIWEFQLSEEDVEGHLLHELILYNPNHEGFKTGFYKLNGNPDWMYNDDQIEVDAHALWITPLYLTPQEQRERAPKGLKTLNHVIRNMEENGGFLYYEYKDKEGGLTNQGWMDSRYSVQHEDPRLNTYEHKDGIMLPPAPIALPEAQIHAWKALHAWADILGDEALREKADRLKKQFQEDFVVRGADGKIEMIAHAIDGNENQVRVSGINQAYALSISHNGELIVDIEDAIEIGRKLTSPAMFNPRFGVRTFEEGHKIKGDNYHLGEDGSVGVYWTKATGEVEEGLRNLAEILEKKGLIDEAQDMMEKSGKVAFAMLRTGLDERIGTREQFYVKDGQIKQYVDNSHNPPIKHPLIQLWSASALLKASYNPVVQKFLS